MVIHYTSLVKPIYLKFSKTLKAKGRHDPCVVNRAIPIVESMAAMVLMDAILIQKMRK